MTTVTFRTDADTDAALDTLTESGEDRSTVIRAALVAAARTRARDRLRAEASTLARDPEDVAETRAILDELGEPLAWRDR